MYAVHTTQGFVIGSRPSGEAGKLLSIFTKDFGLILASAQGIRFEKSKLRPFVQDYSRGVFSFVRGKEFWRLTNAQELEKSKEAEKQSVKNEGAIVSNDARELVVRVSSLLNRLLQGEEAHPELFVTLDSLFHFLDLHDEYEYINTLESLIVIRILHRLGYIGNIPEFALRIESDNVDVPLLHSLRDSRQTLNQHINRALRESHL